MRTGQVKLCGFVLAAMTGVSVQAMDRPQPDRTNPRVFDFFRQQLLESNFHADASGRVGADLDINVLDSFAYSLARDFCLHVDEKLDDLEQGFAEVQSARSEALSESGAARPGAQARWSESLRHVSNAAKKLHGMLRIILGGLHPAEPSSTEYSAREIDPGFENETKIMGEQILRLDRRIRGVLSGRSFTISVEELRSDDILMLLSKVQTEAAEMKEKLDASAPPTAQSSKRTGG